MALYVLSLATGHNWLVNATSAAAAKSKWNREDEEENGEDGDPAIVARRPTGRKEIEYLRDQGQADA